MPWKIISTGNSEGLATTDVLNLDVMLSDKQCHHPSAKSKVHNPFFSLYLFL